MAAIDESDMQDGIHPDYHPVVFHDIGANYSFMTCSTMTSKEKIKWEDGKEYPLVTVDISSASHPFYRGKMTLIDCATRPWRRLRRAAASALSLAAADPVGLRSRLRPPFPSRRCSPVSKPS
jgi:large subunit ribosomal protein L31